MDTLSWLEVLIAVTVIVGAVMYHFGHAMGKEQQKLDTVGRMASMRNHPSYSLRVSEWEKDNNL